MWRLLGLSPWRITVAIGWGTLALGSGLGLAALAAWLIARAWEMPPVLDLSVAVVSVRALGISRGLCRYLERLATHDVALRAMTTARTTVYRTLARSDIWMRRPARGIGSRVETARTVRGVSVGHATPNSAAGKFGDSARGADSRPGDAAQLRRGDLLVRIGGDIDDLGAVVVRVLVPIAVAIILSAAAIGLLASISVAAAVILAAALAVSGILAPWLSARAARDAETAVRADRAEFTAQAVTVLDHAAELRVAGRLDAALAAADSAARRAVAAEDSAAARNAWAAAATPLSIGASVLGALLIGITIYGPNGGGPGAMTPMALTILVLLPLSAFEAVGTLPAAAQALTTARAALHRLPRVQQRQNAHHDAPATHDPTEVAVANGRLDRSHAPRAVLVAAHDDFGRVRRPTGYPDDDTTVRNRFGALRSPLPDNLPDRPEGRRIAVVGPSGAGKTTLLMHWAGLFDTPKAGVTFFAEDAHLFGTSVLENLRVARGDLTEREAELTLRTVGLGDWLDSLPDGVDTDLIGGAAAVSGGQRRRILLARALISPARVLLLDEPTEHLDDAAGAQLLRDLLDVDSGLVEPNRTVVLVTHRLPPEHHADTIVRVSASGQVTTDFPTPDRVGSPRREIPLPLR
ncbi:ATP-binding cassette domain-containing protein [Nocardia australiensis]|uniref:ATP-binding cassette domain-containing protein n=1 Tax=Nocardia australiensis TaxID=2887191 RepID=UPI001D138496|nr:ATP-binding cassette domain-containing protein [Nocardia australiensis]